MRRPSFAYVDLGHLLANLHVMRDFIGSEVACMAMVKADAYGHGAVACGRALESAGVEWLGVALVEEGLELRQAGLRCPILCLGSFWPGQETIVIENNLTPVVCDLRSADLLNSAARSKGMIIDVHVKVDTGMGRFGISRHEVATFAAALSSLPNLRLGGLLSHFAAAEAPAHDSFTELQMRRFDEACLVFRRAGHDPQWVDIANSAAAVIHASSRRNMVRLGGALYGLLDDILSAETPRPRLEPVLSLKSRIAQLRSVSPGESVGYGRSFVAERETTIALIPIGYGDGYPRGLSNMGQAIVRSRKVLIAGRISMDWMTLDVTDISDVAVGDEVTLIGENGALSIKAADLARVLGTISYEIPCNLSPRLPRIYVGQASQAV